LSPDDTTGGCITGAPPLTDSIDDVMVLRFVLYLTLPKRPAGYKRERDSDVTLQSWAAAMVKAAP
jgi:hypothetical protein